MGFLAACPYMLKSVLGPLGGLSADFLIKYKIMSIRNVRALYYAVGKCAKMLVSKLVDFSALLVNNNRQ